MDCLNNCQPFLILAVTRQIHFVPEYLFPTDQERDRKRWRQRFSLTQCKLWYKCTFTKVKAMMDCRTDILQIKTVLILPKMVSTKTLEKSNTKSNYWILQYPLKKTKSLFYIKAPRAQVFFSSFQPKILCSCPFKWH